MSNIPLDIPWGETTRDESYLIDNIIDRFLALNNSMYFPTVDYDRLTMSMDLEATNLMHCKMDFKKLLEAPRETFMHDVLGIRNYMDRETGKLTDCFLPRCAKHDKEEN